MAVQWERREQTCLVQWFRLKYKDILIAASANGGRRNAFEAANMKREGVLAGMPDIQVCRASRHYHGLFIELKTPKSEKHAAGIVSPLQKQRLSKLMDEGYYAVACWGWLQAQDVIDWYLAEGSGFAASIK